MERYSDEAIRIIDELHTERLDYEREYIPLIDAAQKLDAYESTGMDPENICVLHEELCRYKELGDIQRLRELVNADREGRCVILPTKEYTDKDGEKALEHAMFVCRLTNNAVNRYTADAIAEKLTREEAENALKARSLHEIEVPRAGGAGRSGGGGSG